MDTALTKKHILHFELKKEQYVASNGQKCIKSEGQSNFMTIDSMSPIRYNRRENQLGEKRTLN